MAVLSALEENPEGLTLGELHHKAASVKALQVERIHSLRTMDLQLFNNVTLYSHDAVMAVSELLNRRLAEALPGGRITLTERGKRYLVKLRAASLHPRRYGKVRFIGKAIGQPKAKDRKQNVSTVYV